MKVLIVDAVKDERAKLVDVFCACSKEIVVIGAVARLHMALHALADNPPDVVVTDSTLGDEHAVHLITAARRCLVPPAIVVWASTDSLDERRRCLEAGATRFVPKAAGTSTLVRALCELPASTTQPSAADRFALIGRLAAGIAHDLTNYLGVLDLSLTTTKLAEVKTLRSAVDSAIRLTSNLTRYARGSTPPLAGVDLRAVVGRVVDTFWRALPESVGVVLALDPVPLIAGNEAELEQLVLNLLLNGADASPDGGTVTLRVHSAGDRVRLEVEDSGPGLDLTPIDDALTPSTKRDGAGLGLGIVRSVATRHDATLRVQRNRVTVDFRAAGLAKVV
jgi:signal transduction histidine kinase